MKLCWVIDVLRYELENVFCIGPDSKYFRLYSALLAQKPSSHKQYINKRRWIHSNKTSQKLAVGQIWPAGSSWPTSGLTSQYFWMGGQFQITPKTAPSNLSACGFSLECREFFWRASKGLSFLPQKFHVFCLYGAGWIRSQAGLISFATCFPNGEVWIQ